MKIRKSLWAVAVSVMLLAADYLVGNSSLPLFGGTTVMQWWDILKTVVGVAGNRVPDEIAIIDVHYDKQLAPAYETEPDGETQREVGCHVLTDRRKLLAFLDAAQRLDNYKYILLDIRFTEGITTEYDSALFATILGMERVVIACHDDEKLADPRLYAKAGYADYTTTRIENNFSKYKLVNGDKMSMPVKMLQDSLTFSHWGPLYFCNGRLCRSALTLLLPVRSNALVNRANGNVLKVEQMKLGCDVLGDEQEDDDTLVSCIIKDKIVVVGDMEDDVHDTYAGRTPGALINLNAYYALCRGDHLMGGRHYGALLFYLMMAVVYFFIARFYFYGITLRRPSWLKRLAARARPWMRSAWHALASLIGVNALLWIIATLAYVSPLNLVYNVWIPVAFFSVIDVVKTIKHKNK